jgi:anaerobic selenocysteine-containing dehydrogenase
MVDGKFVRVEGNPEAFNNWGKGCASLCAKGYTGPQYLYAPGRLLYPMKRIGAKGEVKFQRITWDEALETIADKLKEYKSRYGAESYGVLSPEFWPVLNTVGRRFLISTAARILCTARFGPLPHGTCQMTVGFNSRAPDD